MRLPNVFQSFFNHSGDPSPQRGDEMSNCTQQRGDQKKDPLKGPFFGRHEDVSKKSLTAHPSCADRLALAPGGWMGSRTV